jgi:DTW domain-containing protein YfiP
MHHRESWRPTSTGHLIHRVLTGSRQHIWRRERGLAAADVRVPGRELWILHPAGPALPAGVPPESAHVLLLDGSWREAKAMAQDVAPWGRLVGLPMAGVSRYWLRTQQDGGRFSTVEALLFLLKAFGLAETHRHVQLQFELHVYASLRARGRKEQAEEFLIESPLMAALPELIAQLNERRPRGNITGATGTLPPAT